MNANHHSRRPRRNHRRNQHRERGATMLVVLVLMTMMLLGVSSLARMAQTSAQAVGNASYREASLQASEVGVNTAFRLTRDQPEAAESADNGSWYFAAAQPTDAQGVPQVDWALRPSIAVGAYTVSYVVERVCSLNVVTAPLQQCLVKQVPPTGGGGSRDTSRESIDPQMSKQFRATVRVVGPKNTTTVVQSLITKG